MKLGIALAAILVLAALGSAGTHAAGDAPNPKDFVARIHNPWFPLVPGTTFVYRGVKDGKQSRDVFTVTHQTKLIQRIRCTAVADRLYLAGRLGERTTDWYAQDRLGNVWYFGESTAELDRAGHVTSREGTWSAGRSGAQAGIYITGHPAVGQSRRQEYYAGHADDHFKIVSLNAAISVPYTSSHHALLTKEWTPLEPRTLDHKYYVRGIGEVKEVSVKGPLERAELVSIRHS